VGVGVGRLRALWRFACKKKNKNKGYIFLAEGKLAIKEEQEKTLRRTKINHPLAFKEPKKRQEDQKNRRTAIPGGITISSSPMSKETGSL